MNDINYFSSFTGVGGFDLAVPNGWKCVGFSEIDKYANMVLKYRFPDVKNYGDINAIKWEEIPDFEVLFGGTPCQDLSLAGKRKGLAGERSGLFFKFVEALKAKKPKYFIWENVKGALSSSQGRDFVEVLNQFSEAGYSLWWQVLNAKHFGVPQNRERIFVVGFRDRSPPEVFFEPTSSAENNELQGQSQEANSIELTKNMPMAERVYDIRGQAISLRAGGGGYGGKTGLYAVQAVLTPSREKKRQNGRRFKNPEEPMFTLTGQDIHGVAIFDYRSDEGIRIRKNNMSPALTSHGNSAGGVPIPMIQKDTKIRRLTPIECERLMSWSSNWTRWGIDEKGNKVEISDTQRYKMAGNGVVSNVVKWIIENVILNGR